MILYYQGKPLSMSSEAFSEFLDALPIDPESRVALDTEASGLFLDGDWHTNAGDCQPKARVSAVSVAWEHDGKIYSFAVPFDQGRVTGKPGLWDHETNRFKRIQPLCTAQVKKPKVGLVPCQREHDNRCHTTTKSKHDYVPGLEPIYNACVNAWQALLRWLKGRPLVFHNAKYDLHIMRAGLRDGTPGYDFRAQFVWDTQTVQAILEPTQSNALKPTARRLWGEHEGDEKEALDAALKLNGTGLTKRYDLVDWSVIGPYAAKDAELTIRLFYRQQHLWETGAVEDSDKRIIAQEFKLTDLLYRMEIKGLPFDAKGMAHEADHMHMEVKSLESQLPFQPPNITQAKQWFFGTLALPPIKTTDQGAASLDAEVVGRLAADGHEGAELWQRIANYNSALAKWYERWPHLVGDDGRLRTNFRQGKVESDRNDKKSGGAISGRLSTERVQTQGVPKEYRIPKGIRGVKEFIKGNNLDTEGWELDISNAEIRVFAWLSRCIALAERINTGANIHDENTRAIFGIEPDHPEWGMYRDLVKIGIFSDWYGSGERTMLAQFESGLKRSFDINVVRDFRARLNNAYPEVKKTSREVQRKADITMGGCGYVRLVNGRKRVFGWGERTHKAANACVQGGVAEVMKVWMLDTDARYPNMLINQVHDSIWLEIPKGMHRGPSNVLLTPEQVVQDIQMRGVEIFEQHFSRPENPIMFKIDPKRMW